jgi:hypothetical protein
VWCLGVLNDLAFRCQEEIDCATPDNKISLSDLELSLAEMPQGTLAFRTPKVVALELLKSPASHGAA